MAQETWSPQSCNGRQAQRDPRLRQEQILTQHCGQSSSHIPTMKAPFIHPRAGEPKAPDAPCSPLNLIILGSQLSP